MLSSRAADLRSLLEATHVLQANLDALRDTENWSDAVDIARSLVYTAITLHALTVSTEEWRALRRLMVSLLPS